jgi:PiT family inorganic phosphate transporter
MATAWVLTLPLSAVVGAFCWWIADLAGGVGVILIDFVLLLAASGYLYLRSRRNPVDTKNVNDDWDSGAAASRPAETANA